MQPADEDAAAAMIIMAIYIHVGRK